MDEIRRAFRAMGDNKRLQMLELLAEHEELTVSELAALVQVSQPLMSWHLMRFKRAGLVATRRDGREVYCTLQRSRLIECQEAIAKLLVKQAAREQAGKLR